VIGEPWLIYIPAVAYIDIEESIPCAKQQSAKQQSG
jgi:hypothetical protein